MTTIVVEQELDRPGGRADLSRLLRSSEGCMALNGVTSRRHHLSADGRRAMSLFDAPDAESVRRALRIAASGRHLNIWAATGYETAGDSLGRPDSGCRSLVVVERSYATPTAFDEVMPSKETLWLCFDLHDVKHLASFVAHSQMRIVCIYDAPDAESVRVANRNSGMDFDVAWTAAEVMDHEMVATRLQAEGLTSA